MSKQKRILMLTIICFTILCTTITSSAVSAETRTWNPGNLYEFSNRVISNSFSENLETGLTLTEDYLIDSYYIYNVTGIDILSGLYQASVISTSGTSSIGSYQFSMDLFIANYITLNGLFDFTYSWDYNRNISVLTGFDIGFIPFELIEPDWETLNKRFRTIFNESEVIETLADPYEPIIYNYTFGEIFASLNSYSINGKDTIAKSLNTFGDRNTRWSFVIDLSDIYHIGEYNSTSGFNDYYPIDLLTVEFIFDYEKGGILNRFERNVDVMYTSQVSKATERSSNIIVNGNLKSLSANFAYLSIIPAMLAATIILKRKTRRNN